MKTFDAHKLLYHSNRIFGGHHPITADVFLTNYCNCGCCYCNYRRWPHDPGSRYMHYADFVRYCTRLRELGILGVILTGGGEPTLNPDFPRICEWLECNGVPYGINTNLLLYPGAIKPRYLKVSLDAWDGESYLRKRGVHGFDAVVANLRRFAEEKVPETRLGVQLLAESYSELDSFLAMAKALPVDYISVRPMESTSGQFYANAIHRLDARLILARLEYEHAVDSRVTCSPKWADALRDVPVTDCPSAWSQLAIDERGNVMYCCQRPYDTVGSIMDDDILERKAAFCPDYTKCDYPCRLSRYNELLSSLPVGFNDVEFI